MAKKTNKKVVVEREAEVDRQLILIGNRMRELRKKEFSNYEQFAFTHNLGRSPYGKTELGQLNITMATFLKIIRALNISLADFFDDDSFRELIKEPEQKK